LSNLTGPQIAAITSGQPVRQVWTISSPQQAAHTSYADVVVDEGIFAAGALSTSRIIKAGSRKHEVWNPHPQEADKPKALRYSIEAANHDGKFHMRSGSFWNPYGLYDADVSECFLTHQIYIRTSASLWEEVLAMKFSGRVISVDYNGGASANRTSSPVAAPNVAVITAEQEGAWQILRRTFTRDDGDMDRFVGLDGVEYWWDIAPVVPT
jgi:hypothetical protein